MRHENVPQSLVSLISSLVLHLHNSNRSRAIEPLVKIVRFCKQLSINSGVLHRKSVPHIQLANTFSILVCTNMTRNPGAREPGYFHDVLPHDLLVRPPKRQIFKSYECLSYPLCAFFALQWPELYEYDAINELPEIIDSFQ